MIPDAFVKLAVHTTEFCAVGTPAIEKLPLDPVVPATPWHETLAPGSTVPEESTTVPTTVVRGSTSVEIVTGAEFATVPDTSTAVAVRTIVAAPPVGTVYVNWYGLELLVATVWPFASSDTAAIGPPVT
jgi:hypothetical protein